MSKDRALRGDRHASRPDDCGLLCISHLAGRGGDPIFETDGETPASLLGGLIFIRHGDQTTLSLGGVFLPRQVKVTTATPEGPVVARFVIPSFFHMPVQPPLPDAAPAFLRVETPDPDGMLYVEGELVRGTARCGNSSRRRCRRGRPSRSILRPFSRSATTF